MRFIFLFSLLFAALFSSEINLTEKQANFIAKKVWQNEGAGKDKYLIWWNKGEDFASLGIGHFIWFPKDHTERFREVFPLVVDYMQKKGIEIPSWLTPETDFPWQTKESFIAAKKAQTVQYLELFHLLKQTFGYQATFMAERLSNALPQMLESIEDEQKKELINRRFYEVMHNQDGTVNERGLYVLLDYTNFKGEGTLKSERYKGQGWGLLQVLEHMDPKEQDRLKAFAESASYMLSRRIGNSPPERGEERWRKGWNVRLDTYWR